jgi:putative transposase
MTAVQNELLQEGQHVPLSKLCQWLGLPRSTAYYQPRERSAPRRDLAFEMLVFDIVQEHPTFGVRRVWALLRFMLGLAVNKKRVARLFKRKGWSCKLRSIGGRPRVQVSRSVADRPDERWSTDIALLWCGEQDGWCSFVPVLDCCTRQVLGWELAHTARAKTAERALESALLGRFGCTRGAPVGMSIRHDNGLVFGSRLFRAVVRDYGLKQEFITPYTPEQNGLAERFIRSFKEECVWQHRFDSIDQARSVIAKWIDWYNTGRPHQALNYKTPQSVYENARKAAA